LSKAFWPQLQEVVALAVAARYSSSTFCSKASAWPKSSTMTEWSITRSTGTSGLILLGIAAELGHRVAHRGEVDHGRARR